ncbi:BRCT domain-containing protein [Schizosaccharomyces japonicus yFS275]|uniref:BRCT domain-containing protein n=1 Tax=Schizosaccharomyces japonicus (strain yFS275 / FY16936) TaxID=402676 RepID=B6K6V6_SCHJY|nr:BRCT domain-containing protein [Schizosaccharomyces japonicus yFS275]EEB09260.1 BRCT domain-containing protein [Schizosaccharomyces japonicus yFS275]
MSRSVKPSSPSVKTNKVYKLAVSVSPVQSSIASTSAKPRKPGRCSRRTHSRSLSHPSSVFTPTSSNDSVDGFEEGSPSSILARCQYPESTNSPPHDQVFCDDEQAYDNDPNDYWVRTVSASTLSHFFGSLGISSAAPLHDVCVFIDLLGPPHRINKLSDALDQLGANVVTSLSRASFSQLTHVVLDQMAQHDWQRIQASNKHLLFIDPAWVDACRRSKRKVSELPYIFDIHAAFGSSRTKSRHSTSALDAVPNLSPQKNLSPKTPTRPSKFELRRLEHARRKSESFKPSVGSPLKHQLVFEAD